jgi:DNA-directed RNA polymerase subunit M/transcription elongation factor TFIIS|tara:strand:+ start:2015 stop:2524 length:510 start_codon:yes stop_codon:yes gene_type:complete
MELREYVVSQYAELLSLEEDDTIPRNLEIGTNNWAINKSLKMRQIPAFDNRKHTERYKQKFLELKKCLQFSPDLKKKLLNKELKTSMVFDMQPNHMWPGGPYDKRLQASIERSMKKEVSIVNEKDYKGLFKCAKCREYKTTYYEMQTRSADEPMTVFITCHICDITWKS